MANEARDHGGRVAWAASRFGGDVADWLDLSTGINPRPFPVPDAAPGVLARLPDPQDLAALEDAARRFWSVPEAAQVVAAPGASSLIALIPLLAPAGTVLIPGPTYNEHRAAFEAQGWTLGDAGAAAQVVVNPNNPDGRHWKAGDLIARGLCVIDESFCDAAPGASLMGEAARPGRLVLKSFGKFWGLAGLRLGFAAGDPALVGRLRELLGPWPVGGPAIAAGRAALADRNWAEATRGRLAEDTARLDALMRGAGHEVLGGTTLFRLCDVHDAAAFHDRLARARILTRIFPYSDTWARLGLPGDEAAWARLAAAL